MNKDVYIQFGELPESDERLDSFFSSELENHISELDVNYSGFPEDEEIEVDLVEVGEDTIIVEFTLYWKELPPGGCPELGYHDRFQQRFSASIDTETLLGEITSEGRADFGID